MIGCAVPPSSIGQKIRRRARDGLCFHLLCRQAWKGGDHCRVKLYSMPFYGLCTHVIQLDKPCTYPSISGNDSQACYHSPNPWL